LGLRTGELKACEHMELLKQKQKAVSKRQVSKAQKPEKGYFFVTAGPFQPTINKNVYIFCITDDYSRFSWIYFGKVKSQIGKHVKDLVIHLTLQTRRSSF
jgi:hypothetical protein